MKILNVTSILSVAVAAFMLISCQVKPTKVYQETSPKAKSDSKSGDLQITEETVLFDARAPFDYSVAHLNGAVNVRWDDFTQQEKPFIGLLDLDLFALTRKLARLGIDPDKTPVVVVGKGPQGQGEEGRVAWTLKYLGVKNVRFVNQDYFSLPISTAEAPPKENKAIWKPNVDASLIVDMKSFLKESVKPDHQKKVKVLDVRTESEYLGKSTDSISKKAPDIGAINVPWTEFFTAQGLPDSKIVEKLNMVAVAKDAQIYVISTKGVRSAAVTMALRELGFTKVANFAGGYQQLVYEPEHTQTKPKKSRKQK